MSIVVLQLPEVKSKHEERPEKCAYCNGEVFQRWGEVSKPVRDNQIRSVQVYRYWCSRCRRTFRHHPPGVDAADQTARMRKLAAICWVLGLSLRGVSLILKVFGVSLSHTTVWRDLGEQADLVARRRKWQRVRVLGVDGMYPLAQGKKQGVVIAVDLGTGQPVALAQLDEHDPEAVRRFLGPIVQRLGVSVIVTDDLASYHVVAEKLGLEHQVCQFHVRRWVNRTLRELQASIPQAWQWVLSEIKTLLAELPPNGGRRLFELWKQIPERRSGQSGPLSPLFALRKLLIRLSEHWEHYRLFDWDREVPWTNNGTEQVIGRMKMRSRTVRGYKSKRGMLAALLLSGSGVDW